MKKKKETNKRKKPTINLKREKEEVQEGNSETGTGKDRKIGSTK